MRLHKFLLLLLAIPAIGVSQFAVIDVGVISKEVANGLTLISQLNQAISTYNHLVAQAKYLENTVSQWGSVHTLWQLASGYDTTGVNSGWLGSINTGLQAASSYVNLVATVNTDLASAPSAFHGAMQRRIATTERIDGQVSDGGATLGKFRALSADLQARLNRLATATTSSLAGDNTAAAIANKQNAAALLAIEVAQSQSEIERQLLNQSNERMIAQREQMANQINADARFYSTVDAALGARTQNLSRDYQNMRQP